jgi:hypothetical protein
MVSNYLASNINLDIRYTGSYAQPRYASTAEHALHKLTSGQQA